MDIKINAKDHPNQEKLSEFYTNKLQKKFGNYPFISTMKVDIKADKNQCRVGLTVIPHNGNMMYADNTDHSEHTAFTEAMNKIKRQIEKYKQVHYKSSNRTRIE